MGSQQDAPVKWPVKAEGKSIRGGEMSAPGALFVPVQVGPLELPSRIVMSPMTRIRAGEGWA